MLPVPAVERHQLTRSDTGERLDVVKASTYWQRSQTAALFTNELGRLLVARVDHLPPNDLPLILEEYVTENAYGKAVTQAPWTTESLAEWVTAFTGKEITAQRTLGRKQSFRYPCREYSLQSGEARCFLVRVPVSKGDARFVAFLFEFVEPERIQNRSQAIAQVVRSVVAGTVTSGEKKTDMRFQDMASRSPAGDGTETYRNTREQVISNIRALDSWWYAELPHYILVSNLDARSRDLAQELQKNIEQLRASFEKIWPAVQPIDEVSVIRLFNTREEYLSYVGPELAWTLGVWMPSKRELVISPVEGKSSSSKSGKMRERILNTAYHEAFHQYVFYALDRMELPLWMNEGHACLFEECAFDRSGRGVRTLENEDRLGYFQIAGAVRSSPTPIVDLMLTTQAEFYAQGMEGRERALAYNYAASWALVYFLRKGGPTAYPAKGYDKICDNVIRSLGRNPGAFLEATETALAGMDRQQLQDDFDAFWDSKRLRGAAERHAFP